MSGVKNNSLFKSLGVLLGAILILWLIHTLVFGTGYGVRMGFAGYHGGGYVNMSYGYGLTGTLAVALLFIIKVLFALFIVGLVVGIAVAVKNLIFTEKDIQTIKGTFTGKKTVVIKETCGICGKELEADWKVCPHCGKELNA